MQVAQQPELKNDPDTVFVGNFSCLLRQHVFRCFFSFFGSATAPGNVPRFRHRHMEALKSPDLNINTATIPSHVDHHSVPPFVQ